MNTQNRRFLVATLLAVTLGVTAMGAISLSGCNPKPGPSPVAEDPRPAIVPSPSPQSDLPGDKPVTEARTVTVYSVHEDSEGAQKLEPKEVVLKPDVASSPAKFAIQTLIDDPKSPLPKGTTLRSIKIGEDGLATVDFSKELKDNFPGGEQAEALALNAVLSTLGQFKSVKTVQFLVDGKKIDSLGGGQTLDEPLPVPQAGTAVGQAE